MSVCVCVVAVVVVVVVVVEEFRHRFSPAEEREFSVVTPGRHGAILHLSDKREREIERKVHVNMWHEEEAATVLFKSPSSYSLIAFERETREASTVQYRA